jgi:hypothetical protein
MIAANAAHQHALRANSLRLTRCSTCAAFCAPSDWLVTGLQAVIGSYAVPILEEQTVWGTSDETRTAYLDSEDVARMALASLRYCLTFPLPAQRDLGGSAPMPGLRAYGASYMW